ncbi:MAG: hypothetical protein ABIR62_04035 [Dokdonella sp.]|uniref:hypothetical protein n=1 Tax=Dokdonella sp. TaxID=2291710 RepID=UPI003263197F
MTTSNRLRFNTCTLRRIAFVATFACVGVMHAAHADIGITGASTPTSYARGRINSYLLDLHMVSDAFAGVDALTFQLPENVTLSAVRKRNTFSFCSDVHPLVDGMGTTNGGWYQLGWPVLDGCGSLSGSPDPGEEQIVIVDVDVPADYTGDLPVVVNVLGDGNGDPPNEASLTLTLSDEGAPTQPIAALPAKLAVALDAGIQRSETLVIRNSGAGTLSYAVTTANSDGVTPPDCGTQAAQPWLTIGSVNGTVAAGQHDDVTLTFDAGTVATGDYTAALCVATNDAAHPMHAIPLVFQVEATSCAATDRLFANGFDDASDGACGRALRTFDNRDAFVAAVAPGYETNAFTALRTGYVHGPLLFGGTFTYAVSAAPQHDIGDFYLFDGAGELSTVSASETSTLTITFTGAPVTAIGGNVWGQMYLDLTSVDMNLQPPTTIRIELGDGAIETFTSTSQQDFRGFVATQPIHSLTVSAPEANVDGNFVWGVFDNLVVGRGR